MAPRREIKVIDLTQDSDDDMEDEDDADQGKALLARFMKPTVGQSRPLKRKSPTGEVEVRATSVKPYAVFRHEGPLDPLPKPNENDKTVDNSTSLSINSPKPWSLFAASGNRVKRESREQTPKSFAGVPPPPRPILSLQSHLPSLSSIHFQTKSSNASSRGSSERPSYVAKNTSRSSTSVDSRVSSRDNSADPTKKARDTSTSRHTPSPSVMTKLSKLPQVKVVIPPLQSPHVSETRSLSKRKINRLHSASSESEEESDPDEPKGIKQKYYPIEMYDLQANMGRYPKARSTNSDSLVLPTRPATPNGNISRGYPKPPQSRKLYLRELLEKKLRKIQGPPVTMATDWDGTGSIASNFEFTNTYKLRQGVTRVAEEFNYGCDCGFQCDPSSCTCLSKEEDSEELMVAYEHRNGKLLLKESFLKRKAMIYECSRLCPCPPTCWNRLVQHGRKIRLEIFHTGDRGFGLRSLDIVHKGQFIDTYLGEVITSAEAELREDATTGSNGSHTSPSYLFSLDWFPLSSDNESDNDEDGTSSSHYVVDGQRFGGPSRFMNHSCNPNCKMIPVSTHHGDQKIYDLAFFARRDIPPGVELTFDYNPGWTPEMNSDDPNAVKCLCGEAKCRGQLWPNQRKSTNF